MIRMNHVGVCVEDLESAINEWCLYLEVDRRTVIVTKNVPEKEGDVIDVALVPIGEGYIEILAPVKPDGNLARTIKKRGVGLNHIGISVKHFDYEWNRLHNLGFTFVDTKYWVDHFGTKYTFTIGKPARTLIELAQDWEPTGPSSWGPIIYPERRNDKE